MSIILTNPQSLPLCVNQDSDPYDESEAYFSEEEQIERYAQNIVF